MTTTTSAAPTDLALHLAVRLARRHAADEHLWRPRLDFDPDRRFYTRLLASAEHEVWLLTWLPGQSTGWHDHGSSSGAFVVLQGALTEDTADGGVIRPVRRVHRPAGTHGFGPGYVHRVGNGGPDPAASLHVYSPRLTVMNRFVDINGHLEHVGTEREGGDW